MVDTIMEGFQSLIEQLTTYDVITVIFLLRTLFVFIVNVLFSFCSLYSVVCSYFVGTAVAQWLRCCATSEGRWFDPRCVIGIFH